MDDFAALGLDFDLVISPLNRGTYMPRLQTATRDSNTTRPMATSSDAELYAHRIHTIWYLEHEEVFITMVSIQSGGAASDTAIASLAQKVGGVWPTNLQTRKRWLKQWKGCEKTSMK